MCQAASMILGNMRHSRFHSVTKGAYGRGEFDWLTSRRPGPGLGLTADFPLARAVEPGPRRGFKTAEVHSTIVRALRPILNPVRLHTFEVPNVSIWTINCSVS
jgi:hypothetical protein